MEGSTDVSEEQLPWMYRTDKSTLSKLVMFSESEMFERSRLIHTGELYETGNATSSPKEDSVASEKVLEANFSRTISEAESSVSDIRDVARSKQEIYENDTKIVNYDDLVLTEEEKYGFLTDRIIASGLSDIGYCPVSKGYVYTKLQLLYKNLSCITLLQYHRYLQVIDLSHNRLEDISILSKARYLRQLDVSYNLLSTAPGFTAPLHLETADFSYNLITKMENFAEFSLLQNLNISHNYINNLNDLHSLRYLEYLNISYNYIDSLDIISNLTAYDLNLEGNPIVSHAYSDIPTLRNVKHLNLSFSLLKTLSPLKGMYMLQELEVRNNRLQNLLDINHLKCLRYLMKLDLRENEITTWKKYRSYVISALITLCCLDGKPVTWMEKIHAKTEFDPDLNLVAACIQTRNKILENWDQSCVRADTFPIDQGIYPIIVLVGPLGSSKAIIAHRIAAAIPEKVHLAITHTTRCKNPEEENGVHHYFVTNSEFSALASSGAFVCVSRKLGQNDGLGWAEVAKAVQKNCVALTFMNLPSALQLFSSKLQPVLILAIPQDENNHIETLRAKYFEHLINYDASSTEELGTKRCPVEPESNCATGSRISEESQPTCHCIFSSEMFNLELYVKKLLASREKYFKMHAENPGLFLKTIYTDVPNEAIKEVIEIIQDQYEHHQPCNFSSHPDYQKIISTEILHNRLDTFQLEMKFLC